MASEINQFGPGQKHPPMLAVARKAQKIEQLKVDTMKQQIKVGDQPRTGLNSKGGMVGSRRGKPRTKG